MNEAEIRKTMEFILEQQAQFAANIQHLQEERAKDNPRLNRLEESFLLLVQLAQTTDNRLDRIESSTAALELRIESSTAALESNMAALAAAQTHTDERLSALIDIVREGRNGN